MGLGYGVAGRAIPVSLVEKLRNTLLQATQKVAVSREGIQGPLLTARCLVSLSLCPEIQGSGCLKASHSCFLSCLSQRLVTRGAHFFTEEFRIWEAVAECTRCLLKKMEKNAIVQCYYC